MTHAPLRRLPVALVLFAVLAATPASALGHAELDTVTPADKATVQGSPAEIVLTFTQNLDSEKSSIRVVNPAGTVVVQGGTVPSGSPREMHLAVPTALAVGTYTIRWTSFSSEDQEQARGTTTFTVGAAATPSPTAVPSVPGPSPSTVPSAAPPASSPSPPTTPAASTTDALIPIVAALLVLAALGAWLLRGRFRARA
jgi:methionine-rich copper-binding protein CopC